MIAFGSFLFFFILAALLIPSVMLRLAGKSANTYNLLLTVVMLAIVFFNQWAAGLSLIAFFLWQVTLLKGYWHYRQQRNATATFVIVTLGAILPLVLVKVVPLFAVNSVIGFLGISYVTFKAVQIVMETRDGVIKERMDIRELFYFLLFFPSLSSGPIDRYRRFKADYEATLTREQYIPLVEHGIARIFRGFLYKFIIGYAIKTYVIDTMPIWPVPEWVVNWSYMYAYSCYLFFDFAGYSAFAIGVSYILGIKTPENFNLPFLSRNIKDFWNRWHLTLSFWFRDYVYMRFVFWMTKKKWLKDRQVISNLSYVLLFLLMGIWHGLAWAYVAYGVYHAALIIGYNAFERWNKKHKKIPNNKWTHALSVIVTFHVICFGFYIFSGRLF